MVEGTSKKPPQGQGTFARFLRGCVAAAAVQESWLGWGPALANLAEGTFLLSVLSLSLSPPTLNLSGCPLVLGLSRRKTHPSIHILHPPLLGETKAARALHPFMTKLGSELSVLAREAAQSAAGRTPRSLVHGWGV